MCLRTRRPDLMLCSKLTAAAGNSKVTKSLFLAKIKSPSEDHLKLQLNLNNKLS